MFKKLYKNNNSYIITSKKEFIKNGIFKIPTINMCFNFAWEMSFGKKGEHRKHRTGGTLNRKNGEIFINAFQGKLAEFAIYNIFFKNGIKLSVPDLKTYGLGEWDYADFIYNNFKFSIKSTAYFGNLLLLEEKDWDIDGKYIPNDTSYDYHILVRIKPDGKRIMKSEKFLYSDDIDQEKLYSLIRKSDWEFEITGYITNDDLKNIILEKFILPKGQLLNGTTSMDASNYYIQSGDLKNIENIFKEIKK